jgi:hypothetical protein
MPEFGRTEPVHGKTKLGRRRAPAPAGTASADPTARLLALQRLVGNRAVGTIIDSGALPTPRPSVIVQRDDVVEGQTDRGDLVDGVAEVTEGLGMLSLEDMGVEEGEESGETPKSPFVFGSLTPSSPFGSFGSQTPSFGTSSPFGSFGTMGQQFGMPSTFPVQQPVSMPTTIFGSGFGSTGHTFASFAQAQGPGWGQQTSDDSGESMKIDKLQDPDMPIQRSMLSMTPMLIQRIGAGIVQNSGVHQFTTGAGGYVEFVGPLLPGDGPALTLHKDVNIMDPMYPTKLDLPAHARPGGGWKRWPPLKNKRSMHFMAANWAAFNNLSTASPAPNTWHHHKDKGRMQLIDSVVHGAIKHNGGHSTWGKK